MYTLEFINTDLKMRRHAPCLKIFLEIPYLCAACQNADLSDHDQGFISHASTNALSFDLLHSGKKNVRQLVLHSLSTSSRSESINTER